MTSHYMAYWAFLLLVFIFPFPVPGLFVDALNVEPPSIDPPSGEYRGEVMVLIMSNQPHSYTYFTLDGKSPTDRDDILVDGTEIVLSEPGRYVVKAVTYPKLNLGVLNRSDEVSAEYNITAASLSAPIAFPVSDKFGRFFRGSVSVELSYPSNLSSPSTQPLREIGIRYFVTYLSTLSSVGTSGSLPPLPVDAKWTVYNAKPIYLDKPGTHIVRAQAYNTSTNPIYYSPRNRFVYRVRPPLVYDVSTECCGDTAHPVLGHPFTVWLSHAMVPTSLFLTTSAKGCETERHILDETVRVDAQRRQVAFKFRTCTEPQQKVFVCLKEEGETIHKRVSRRKATGDDAEVHAFSVVAPKGTTHAVGINCTRSFNVTQKPKIPNPAEGAGNGLGVSLLFSLSGTLLFGLFMYVRHFCNDIPPPVRARQGRGRVGREDRVELLTKKATT